MKPIAIFHEHPDWFRPLFATLDRLGIPYVRLNAAAHAFDPSEREAPWSAVFNRASPSAFQRGHGGAIFYTSHWLRHLERLGVPVVNGADVYELETSKAKQLVLFEQCRVPYPRSRVINAAHLAVEAAAGLRFPLLVKANVGGSGAGITRFDRVDQLTEALERREVQLGVDGTALVQEFAPLAGGHIHRVEVLGRKFLYAIRVHPAEDSFNLCPADVCRTTDGAELARGACALDAPRNGMRVEAFTPSPETIARVELLAERAKLDVGGIEYLVDDRDGQPYFYDLNALSNFVADPLRVVGFDPFERLASYLQARATREERS
jgi:hypothetical protein